MHRRGGWDERTLLGTHAGPILHPECRRPGRGVHQQSLMNSDSLALQRWRLRSVTGTGLEEFFSTANYSLLNIVFFLKKAANIRQCWVLNGWDIKDWRSCPLFSAGGALWSLPCCQEKHKHCTGVPWRKQVKPGHRHQVPVNPDPGVKCTGEGGVAILNVGRASSYAALLQITGSF